MHIICLDLEGVLVPEIWINVAIDTGIDALKLTTRDISDYDVLMKKRLGILADHEVKLTDIQAVISKMEPLPGAYEFLMVLRSLHQVIILSDTFTQFANPLMEKLDWPALFCNSLVVEDDGSISGYRLRTQDGKRKSVEALTSIGFDVIAAGDSYNDISMLKAAKAGILFRPPKTITEEFPSFPAVESHAELAAAIHSAISDSS